IKAHCEKMCNEVSKTTGLPVEHMIQVIKRHYREGCVDQQCRKFSVMVEGSYKSDLSGRNQNQAASTAHSIIFNPAPSNAAALSEMGMWAGQELEPQTNHLEHGHSQLSQTAV